MVPSLVFFASCVLFAFWHPRLLLFLPLVAVSDASPSSFSREILLPYAPRMNMPNLTLSLEEECPFSPLGSPREYFLIVYDLRHRFRAYKRLASHLCRFQQPRLPSSSFPATLSTRLSSPRATSLQHSRTVSVSSSSYKTCTTLDSSSALLRK